MKEAAKRDFSTSFGVFSPTGHVVMVFETENGAERARQALLDNGFRGEDAVHYSNSVVTAELNKSEAHTSNPMQIGQESAKVDQYLAFAKEGCGFVILHTSDDEAARSGVNIVRNFGLKLAEKYNRFTIEELE